MRVKNYIFLNSKIRNNKVKDVKSRSSATGCSEMDYVHRETPYGAAIGVNPRGSAYLVTGSAQLR